jgi:predicted NUDIX family phosphoesterase
VVALLNDDSNEVGQVHLGVVHLVELETDEVTSNEETIIDVGFYTPDELRAGRDQLESWSQLCLDGIERLMV